MKHEILQALKPLGGARALLKLNLSAHRKAVTQALESKGFTCEYRKLLVGNYNAFEVKSLGESYRLNISTPFLLEGRGRFAHCLIISVKSC